jgi:hypothetical protein
MVIKSRMMRWVVHVSLVGDMRNAYKILVGNPRHIWEYDIRMDLNRNRMGVEWIHLAQDRDQWRAVVKTVMNLRVS